MMIIIDKLSYKLSYYIQQQLHQKEEDREVTEYGLQCILSVLIKFIIITILGIIFHTLIEVYIMSLSFMILRSQIGGEHMTTWFKCLSTSIITFVSLSILFKYKIILINDINYINIIIYFTNILIILLFAPYNNVKKFSLQEKFNKKINGIIICSIYVLLILFFQNYYYIVTSIIIGSIIATFNITPQGIQIIKILDQIK